MTRLVQELVYIIDLSRKKDYILLEPIGGRP